jgi:cell shape-determining protein MreC
MNRKINKIIYYFIILIMLVGSDKIIGLVKKDDHNNIINEVLLQENNDLKQELKELSNLDYHDYDYVLGHITIKNLYNTNTYFIDTNTSVNENSPVINNEGLIGIYQNHYLITTSNLNLSIKINNNNGILNDNLIKIKSDNYQIGDKIYTSGLTNIPGNLLVGTIKSITVEENKIVTDIKINYITNNSNYVGILTAYA